MKLETLFHSFSTKKILVVGDVMMDRYIKGSVHRISPEAPVPIVNFTKEENRLGGAANVALNLVALGAKTYIASVIGNEKEGMDMIQLFDQQQIDCQALIKSSNRITTVKTRVLGNNQQLLRIDTEQTHPINSEEENQLITSITTLVEKEGIDAIIFEDYNKGVLTRNCISNIVQLANSKGIITTVDPKKDNFFAYKNVTLFKPNLKELKEGLSLQFDMRQDFAPFEKAVDLLTNTLENKLSFVTLSELGVFIQGDNEKHYLPAHIRTIADVSGAGDTVISVATLCLTAGVSMRNIAQIANISGGLVCEEIGVVSINKEKLQNEILKIIGEEIQ